MGQAVSCHLSALQRAPHPFGSNSHVKAVLVAVQSPVPNGSWLGVTPPQKNWAKCSFHSQSGSIAPSSLSGINP